MVVLKYLNEIWKDIPDYEGKYQGSNYGRIKSLNYNRTGKEQILKLTKNKNGYLMVGLSNHNVCKLYYVHRLIWTTFNGAIPEGYEINHKSECKTDNRLDNLELVTRKENNNWGTRNERVAKALSKSVFQYDLNGNLIKEFKSTIEIERELGYSHSNIGKCCLGIFKQFHGFIWKYK